jgi:hypothetical protein
LFGFGEYSPVEPVGDSAVRDGGNFVFLRSHLAGPLCPRRKKYRSTN